MNFFDVRQLSAGYGKTMVLQDISFSLESGCLMGILGANGCGKTTLMKAICGIVPHEGACRLDGMALETLSARQIAKRLSYIPQRSGISIDMTALDVALMGEKRTGHTSLMTKDRWQKVCLFREQKKTLDTFLASGAITRAQYNKSYGDLQVLMNMQGVE